MEQMEISRLRAELARDIFGKGDGVLRKGPAMKFVIIERHRLVWPIRVQCRVLLASVSGYINTWRGTSRSRAAAI
jgi:hypothetical protein